MGSHTSPSRRTILKTVGAASVGGLTGCMGSSDNSSDTVTIGTVGPMNARAGNDNVTGAQIAVDELNDDGGILGSDVEVITKDNNENDPGVAKQRYQELVLEEEVDMVTGGWLAPAIEQMLEVDKDTNVPHFYLGSATSLTDKLQNDFSTYQNAFRVGDDIREAAGNRVNQFSEIFSSLGAENIAFLFEDLGYNVGMEPILSDGLGSEFDIRVNERFPADTEDFTSLFDTLEEQNVQAVFLEAFITGTQAVLQWADQQRDFLLYGSIGSFQSPTGWQNSSGACEYAMGNSMSIPGAGRNDLTVPYQQKFLDRADHYPAYVGSIAYPGVMAFAEAAEEAGSLNNDDVISALEDITLETPLGTADFQGEDSDFPHHTIKDTDHIYQQGFQWQEKDGEGLEEDEFYPDSGGVQECIWPSKDSTQSPVKPDWVSF